MKALKKVVIIIIYLSGLIFSMTAKAVTIAPVDGYTARSFDGGESTLIVTGEDSVPFAFLSINLSVPDRVVLIFDLANRNIVQEPLFLNFFIRGGDSPAYSNIHLDTFYAPSIRDSAFFNNTDNEVTIFTNFGIEVPFPGDNMSINVTDHYNDFILNGEGFLGFILHATIIEPGAFPARYMLREGEEFINLSSELLVAPPSRPPVHPVPVPSAVFLFVSGIGVLVGGKVRSCINSKKYYESIV